MVKFFSTESWLCCNFWRQTTQGWFLGGCHWLSPRVSPQRGLVLRVQLCVKMYILTYNMKIKKNSLTASTTLVEKKYRSSWFTVQVIMMSHSITFYSVYFELSTVPKRAAIERVDLYSPLQCFPSVYFESRVFIENWKWVSKGCGSYLIHPGKPLAFPPL